MSKKLVQIALVCLVSLLVGSCDIFDRHDFPILKQVDFKENAVYTYNYKVTLKDTGNANVEYRFHAVYRVKVLEVTGQLPQSDKPLILIKTYRSPDDDTAASEYTYNWYHQDGEELTNIANYNPGVTPGVTPKQTAEQRLKSWLRETGLQMASAAGSLPLVRGQSKDDTLFYDDPRLVLQYPVTTKQDPYWVEAGPLRYKKEVDGQEKLQLANREYNTFKITSTLQDTMYQPYRYTDYFSEVGLVRRTSEGRMVRTNAHGDSVGLYQYKTQTELTDYRIKPADTNSKKARD